MMRYRCRICQYIHEGDDPPKRCPGCCLGPQEFELIDQEGRGLVVDRSGESGLWACSVCGYEYADCRMADIAEDWTCPDCGAWKELLRKK